MSEVELAILIGAGGATVARILSKEQGPLDVFGHFRVGLVELARRIEATHPRYAALANSIVELFHCPICLSVWGTIALALLAGARNPLVFIAAPAVAWAVGELGKWRD